MIRKALSFFFSSRSRIACTVLAICLVVALSIVRFRVFGHFEGFYLLEGESSPFTVSDDIMLGDERRLIFALPAERILDILRPSTSHAKGAANLENKWFTSDGSGYVMNRFHDGTRLLTCFSRFVDSDGLETKGLFVGGMLPYEFKDEIGISLNESGMTYFDGNKWNHLWCNVNESIAPANNPAHVISPSSWRFLGSKVLRSTPEELVLSSSHEVNMEGVPFRVERRAFFRAGNRFFTLVINVKNTGIAPAGYFYVYGDEPWVGDYGTSEENVGWVSDRFFKYEGAVDLNRYSWAGFSDSGNEAAGESHTPGGVANFMEWQGNVRPNVVYFSNKIGAFAEEREKVPLNSPDNRVLFAQWGPRLLDPGQSETIILVIGMADNDPATGFPVKPNTAFNPAEYASFLR